MTRKSAITAGVAASLAVVAAGAVVAVVKYRQGHPHTQDDEAALEQLEAHLTADDDQTKRIANLWTRYKERGGASRETLLEMVKRLRSGQLDDDAAVHLEDQLEELGGRAAQNDL